MIDRMGGAVRVLSSSHCHSFAMHGNTLLYFWHGEVSLESVKQTRRAIVTARESSPEGVYVLAFITLGTGMPGNDVRQESAKIDRECGPFIRAHGTVVPGEGFWVASARSVLGTVFLLSRTGYPRKVFRDASPGLLWLRHNGAQHDHEPFLAHVRLLEQKFASAAKLSV
jgi:hypothetical protein